MTWHAALRRLIGRLATFLEDCAAEHKTLQRRELLERSARLHPSANVDRAARLVNGQGDPDAIAIGAEGAVLGELVVYPGGGQITVGERTFIGLGTRIWSAARIDIGSHVLISHNVNILDNNSHSLAWEDRRHETALPELRFVRPTADIQARPLRIEDDVWIGFAASVIGGVTIGRGAVVGAGTMVTRDVAPHTLVVGNPMRVVRRL